MTDVVTRPEPDDVEDEECLVRPPDLVTGRCEDPPLSVPVNARAATTTATAPTPTSASAEDGIAARCLRTPRLCSVAASPAESPSA